MNETVSKGVLKGRPYGGLMILVNKKYTRCTQILCAAERYAVVLVGDLLIINVYFPCVGTPDRNDICENIISNVLFSTAKYPGYSTVVGGDLNTDLDNSDFTAELINSFMADNDLLRCDRIFPCACKQNTFFNDAMNCSSCIDYFLVSSRLALSSYSVLDLDFNLSDHCPITMKCLCNFNKSDRDAKESSETDDVTQLRWDRANLVQYKELTGGYLQNVYSVLARIDFELDSVEPTKNNIVDNIYDQIVRLLRYSSDCTVPSVKKNFFKFWWDVELDELKSRSIASCKLWKASGRPRSGPIYLAYRKDKSAYKAAIRSHQRESKEIYTNDLHDALMEKQGTTFWKCWRSKFESVRHRVNQVDGIVDGGSIAEYFAVHFASLGSPSETGGTRLKNEYAK